MARKLWNLRLHRWTVVTVGCGLFLVVGLAFFAGALTGHWWAERPTVGEGAIAPTDGSVGIASPDAAELQTPGMEPAGAGVATAPGAAGAGAGVSGVSGPRVTGPTATGPRVTAPAVRGPQISASGVTGPRLEGPRVQRPTVRGPRVSQPTSPRIGGGRVGGGTTTLSAPTGGAQPGVAAEAPAGTVPAGPIPPGNRAFGAPDPHQQSAGGLAQEIAESTLSGDAASTPPVDLFAVQVGLYADPEDAEADVEALSGRGHAPYVVVVRALDRGSVARSVRIGPYPSRRAAQEAARNFELDEGRGAAVVRELEGPPPSL